MNFFDEFCGYVSNAVDFSAFKKGLNLTNKIIAIIIIRNGVCNITSYTQLFEIII